MANCVGKRNYVDFISFIIWCLILNLIVFFGCIAFISIRIGETESTPAAPAWSTVLAEYPAVPLMLVFTGLMGMSLGSLAIYHIWISSMNMTTHEDVSNIPLSSYPILFQKF